MGIMNNLKAVKAYCKGRERKMDSIHYIVKNILADLNSNEKPNYIMGMNKETAIDILSTYCKGLESTLKELKLIKQYDAQSSYMTAFLVDVATKNYYKCHKDEIENIITNYLNRAA